jgi:hypothetical protein
MKTETGAHADLNRGAEARQFSSERMPTTACHMRRLAPVRCSPFQSWLSRRLTVTRGPYTWHSRRQGSREIRGVSSMAELQSSKLRTTGSIPSHRSNLTCGSRRVYLWWAAGQVSAVPTVRHLKT